MKWLKYQHKFSSGRSAWKWQLVDDDTDEESARDTVAELAEEYSHSDKILVASAEQCAQKKE